jgi:hypothetical protein
LLFLIPLKITAYCSAIPGLEISPKLAHVKSTTYGRQAPSEKIRKPGKKSKPGIAAYCYKKQVNYCK